MEPIIVTALLKPKENLEDQLLTELKKVQKASREEAGCLNYDLHQSIDDKTFVLHETWKDEEAFEEHVQSGHYQEYRDKTADLVSVKEVYKSKAIQ